MGQELKEQLFTTWFRPGNNSVYILSDLREWWVDTTQEGDEIKSGQLDVIQVVFTRIGTDSRQSFALTPAQLESAVTNGQLVKQVFKCDLFEWIDKLKTQYNT